MGMGSMDLKRVFAERYAEDPEFREKVEGFRREIFTPGLKFPLAYLAAKTLEIAGMMGIEKPVRGGGDRIGKEEFSFKLKRRLDGIDLSKYKALSLGKVEKYVPTVLQPREDVEKGNRLTGVYVWGVEGGLVSEELHGCLLIELTLVWAGESDPLYGVYNDVWRLVAWGRTEDIETLHLVICEGRIIGTYYPVALRLEEYGVWRLLDASFSEESGWEVTQHREKTEEVEELKLYVNTWNHALSFRDLVPDMETVEYRPGANVELKIGRRLEAEKEHSLLKYDDEHLLRR